jgi:hypothetical protein
MYASIDRHLLITSTFNKAVTYVVSTIQSGIESLNTRTARERKQTRINNIKRTQNTHRPSRKINLCRLACITSLHVYATDVTLAAQTRHVIFDTDSVPIRVDNCATDSISNNRQDFEGPVTPVRGRVKGISGYSNPGIQRGTIAWNIEDDNGRVHRLCLPISYYVPDSTSRILSPQHWAQQVKDNKPMPRGTWCATYED